MSAQISNSDDRTDSQWRELIGPQYLPATAMLCLGVTLFAFTAFFVSTALPSTVKELNGEAFISWAQSLYLACAIVSGVATSLVTKQIGARAAVLIASMIFLVATFICVSAASMATLLIGRAAQGLAAGFIEAQCYSFIFVLFPQRLTSKIFGAEAVVWVSAAFAGPVLAGFVTESAGWRAAFALSLPIAAIFALLAWRVIPLTSRATETMAFPGVRLGILAASMLLITWASIQSIHVAIALLALAAASIFVLVRLDKRTAHPLLPQGAFTSSSSIGLGLWVVLLMPLAEAASTVYLIYGLQNVFELRPTFAGAIGSIIAVSWSLTQVAVSTYASAKARQDMIWIGATLLTIGIAGAAVGFAQKSLPLVALSLIPTGAAFGMNWGSISEMLVGSAPEQDRDRVAGLLPTIQSAGFGIGAALAGLVGNTAGFATAISPADVQHVIVIVLGCATVVAIPAALAAWLVVKRLSRGPL